MDAAQGILAVLHKGAKEIGNKGGDERDETEAPVISRSGLTKHGTRSERRFRSTAWARPCLSKRGRIRLGRSSSIDAFHVSATLLSITAPPVFGERRLSNISLRAVKIPRHCLSNLKLQVREYIPNYLPGLNLNSVNGRRSGRCHPTFSCGGAMASKRTQFVSKLKMTVNGDNAVNHHARHQSGQTCYNIDVETSSQRTRATHQSCSCRSALKMSIAFMEKY